MSVLNSFICPNCGNQFPLFIKPSMTNRRGFFSKPDIQCQKCGQLCRAKIDFTRSLFAWPLTAVYAVLIIFLLQTSELPCKLYKEGYWLITFIVLAFIYIIPIIIGIGEGFKLIRAQDDVATGHPKLLVLIQILFVGLFCIGFGYYTGNWMNIMIGLVVWIIIHSLFYIRRRSSKKVTGSGFEI